MNFKEYCEYNKEKDQELKNIKKHIINYISRFVNEQVISVGNPDIVSLKDIDIKLDCCRQNKLIHVEILLERNIHKSLINPKYFKPDNVKNYLREFEINIKEVISSIRKNHASSSPSL